MQPNPGYSRAQITLHWLVALGVIFNYLVSDRMGRALNQHLGGDTVTVTIAPLHVWVGVAVMVLVALRLALRLTQGAPAAEPGRLGLFARLGHGALYLLMVLVPLFGGLAWFAGVTAVADAHALLANVLLIVAGLHALAALFHHFVMKDDILRRMLRPA